jgi:hypothetical protein
MVNGGVAVAVPAALDFCQKWRVPVPDWLIDASVELFCELLKNERPTRRGRTPTHVARARQDNIDFTRWSTVKWQRDAQKDLLDQVESIRQDPDCVGPGWREDREQQQKWFGTTLERAFECASMLLEGTDAFGSPDAIKRSYFKVERSSEDAATRHRYYQIDPQFLMKLGIKWEPFVRPGRKIEPLYKLSLGRN